VALFSLPDTAVAYLSLYVLLHVMIQFPGFGALFNTVVFPGLHRFDYQQVIAVIFATMGPIAQIMLCAACVQWGLRNPIYGSVAGGFGLALGSLLMIVVVFTAGLLLYRRLGMSVKILFMAHFDWTTVKRALLFGAPITANGLLYTGAYSIQVYLLSKLVLNYAEVQANFEVACALGSTGLLFPFFAVQQIAYPLLSSHSEAYSQGKLVLCRYYAMLSSKWGQLIGTFITAVLLAVGDRFILGSLGEQYARAAIWIRFFAVWGSLLPIVWVGDGILMGIGKPSRTLLAMLVEQGTRIVLMFVLAPSMQEWSLVIAYMFALPLKLLVNTFFVHRYLKGFPLAYWQTFVAPILSAVIIFLVLRALGGLIWTPVWYSSAFLLFLGFVVALPLHFFLTGLFGGWDDYGLREFRRAVPLSNVARPTASLFLKCTELGARLSSLHNRFPVTTREEAMGEAAELTRMKVALEKYSEI